MRWRLPLLLLSLPWSAQADTIFLCTAYSGGMFWSSVTCSQKQATIDRMVNVPDGISWDQKVALGEAARAQGQAVAAPPRPVVVQRSPSGQSNRQAECASIREAIANLDSQMRQPQSGQSMDWLKDQRRQLSDQRYRLGC